MDEKRGILVKGGMMSEDFVRNPTRGAPLGTLAIGLLILAGHHFLLADLAVGFRLLVIFGTLFVSLGMGGLIDPRFFAGAMNEAKGVYPTWVRVVSGVLVAIGFISGGILLMFVYKQIPLP